MNTPTNSPRTGQDALWYVNPRGFIVTSTGEVIARVEGFEGDKQALAQIIVRAVNNHDALVSSLEKARSALITIARRESMRGKEVSQYSEEQVSAADAALAAAKTNT